MRLLRLVFCILFFFILVSPVSAQSSSFLKIPGVDCGMAGSSTASSCCYNPTQSLPGSDIASALKGLPYIGDKTQIYTDINTSYERLQDKNSGMAACLHGSPNTVLSDPSCKCQLATVAAEIKPVTELCNRYQFKSSNEHTSCLNCAKGGGFWSGMGCVPLRIENFITSFLLSFGIGLGGFIALLCIIYSAYILQTSAGNPEKIKKAQENITSCILGLILIIFSVFILRLIGVEILAIPFFQ